MSGIVGGNLGRGSGLVKVSAIDDNSVTLAKMAGLARGKLIIGDASGDPAALAVGAANEVLTHDGTDFDWAAAAGGGKILQVVQTTSTSGTLHNSIETFTASNVTGAITPTAASSKIFVNFWYLASTYANGLRQSAGTFKLYQDIDGGGFAALWPGTVGTVAFQIRHTHGADELTHRAYQNITYLDSPSYTLTDVITYTLYGAAGPTGYGNINSSPDGDSAAVILMEVAA